MRGDISLCPACTHFVHAHVNKHSMLPGNVSSPSCPEGEPYPATTVINMFDLITYRFLKRVVEIGTS